MDQVIEERRSRWENEEFRERHAAAMADPSCRSLLSQRMYERLNDPEKRAKLAAAISAAKSRPVIARGVWYPSVTAAAKAIGVTTGAVLYHIKRQTSGYGYTTARPET